MAWWLLALPALWLFILLLFAGPVRAAWREPFLRYPVLIIESDDWGPGPESQTQALRRLAACLNQYRDGSGHTPVMTLGISLSLPDSEAIAASNLSTYYARPITDPAYASILAAMQEGIRIGVFAPQLHGMAHYWPDAVMRAAQSDHSVREWVLNGPGQETEALPSPLQSRWVDASTLPSHPLSSAEIETAVAAEVACYRTVFGAKPAVVVPPTFVWTEPVEAAWAASGARAIVTPGQRYAGRDASGRPDCPSGAIYNGQRGIGGLIYLVRDRYFEPSRGHQAERALAALAEKTAQGRPCLLETHRFNFTGEHLEDALARLDKLLRAALARHPNLRFIGTAELAELMLTNHVALEHRLRPRLAAWVNRMRDMPRFVRLARYSGLSMFFPREPHI
jgi:hypothetical protein